MIQSPSNIIAATTPYLAAGRRMRRTPFTSRVEALGCRVFSVYNHMLLPEVFRGDEADYHHLKTHVQVWDVGCERQVELIGRDAARLAQLMTCRDISKCRTGQCLYVPLVDEKGGMINDPILIRLAEDRFWLSIADSDVLLWAKGLAAGMKLDVTCAEPDVWPLAVQGPKAEDLCAKVLGEEVRAITFFHFAEIEWRGHRFIVARSGWSKQGGFEIYVNDWHLGGALWDELMRQGQAFNVGPGAPHNTERIEGGLLSYGNDFTNANNPFEIGLEKYVHLDRPIEFLGRAALERINAKGIARRMMGLFIDAKALPACDSPWPVWAGSTKAGELTSCSISPMFGKGIGYAMLERGVWEEGTKLTLETPDGARHAATVTPLPFWRP
ncbi:dimethylsulfoniopropionate demethylase [Aestuariivirga sp.]|uniref:dimethylsulfoniopropionate demethylase n=1 Tax=Aestuariivirga sp. TaxID=2650926 RepID=UPI0039E24AE6